MTSIVDFFDPLDARHTQAYEHLMNTGTWPQGFLPEGLEFPPTWNYAIASKMADYWVEHMKAVVRRDEKQKEEDFLKLQS